MKRSILLIFSLFIGIVPSFAQMMPDSTVQVVAYWQLGDKYHYRIENTKYDIVKGDTTVVEKSAEIVGMEVVAADDEKGYRLKVTTMEEQYSNPLLETIGEKWRERFGSEVYFFETGPYGQFERVLPIEGLAEKQETLVEAIVDGVLQKSENVTREQAIAMVRPLISQEGIMLATQTEYAPLLMFHGARLDLREEYPIEDDVPSLFGDGNSIRMTGTFWVDDDLTDEYSAVLRMFKQADETQLKPYLTALLSQTVRPLLDNPEDEAELQKVLEEVYAEAEMTLEDYLFEEVHLGSGWPVQFGFDRFVTVRIGDSEKQQWIQKTVQVLAGE